MTPLILIGNILGIALLYIVAKYVTVLPDLASLSTRTLIFVVIISYLIASVSLVWFTLGRASDIGPLVHIVRFSALIIWFNVFFYFGSEALALVTGVSSVVAPIWAAVTTFAFLIGAAVMFGGVSMTLSQIFGFAVMIIGLGILTSKDWVGVFLR